MLAGFVISVSAVAILTLIVLGFKANTARHEWRMRSPGCYWTWAMAIGLVLGAVTGSPLGVQIFGYVVLLFSAGLWIADTRHKEGQR